jgi:hypothetical protein
MRSWIALASVLVLAGCGAEREAGTDTADAGLADAAAPDSAPDAGPSDAEPQVTWWGDVEPIVRARCQLCHGDPRQFGAPYGLVDYVDTQAERMPGVRVHELMAYRVLALQNRMPPPSQPQLTSEEKQTITAWSRQGAPEGTRPEPGPDGGVVAPDAGGDDPGPSRPVSRSFDVVARDPDTGDPFELEVGETSYKCWAFTVPPGAAGVAEHAFRFEPLIDNTLHNHHMLLFRNRGDRKPDGQPFDCGGFPLDWDMVAGWAPGRVTDELPPGVGVPAAAGDQFVLQVHYDRVTTGGELDQSGVRVVLSADTDYIEAGMLWSGVAWNAPLNGASVSRTGVCRVRTPFNIFTVFPHMHQLGSAISLELRRAGTSDWIKLVDIVGWSFADQPNIAIPPEHQALAVGDELRTSCTWNTQGRRVNFGEASSDEMCFNFVYHYPKLASQYACVSYQP